MLKKMSFINVSAFTNKFTDMPLQYRDNIADETLRTNTRREKLLSYILVIINVFLLLLDILVSKAWTRDVHVYLKFSYLHLGLLLIPLFYIMVDRRIDIIQSTKPSLRRAHNFLINMLVLTVCSIIGFNKALTGGLPLPYIIAMFCIASALLLSPAERYLIFTIPYIFYVMGSFTRQKDKYDLIGDILFFGLLTILALTISSLNYSMFVSSLLNNKIIQSKNEELDTIYKNVKLLLDDRTLELSEAKEYDKLRAAFFSNISHELRTPLNVIMATLQLTNQYIFNNITDDKCTKLSKYLGSMKQNCYRLLRLVNNLIDVTKIDSNYYEINMGSYNIVKIVEDISLSITDYVQGNGLSLVFDTDTEEKYITCDPDSIERIMLNLLSNAVKYTNPGGIIKVNIYDKHDNVEIHVADTGTGIPQDKQQIVFERFRQVNEQLTRNQEGSGIGLSLVKALTEMHGGSVHLESELGKGSKFIITLPSNNLLSDKSHAEKNTCRFQSNVDRINIEFSDIYNTANKN